MKYLVFVALACAPLSAAAQELSPADARTKVGKIVSVKFVVHAHGRNGEFAELHSKDRWDAPGNFFVRLPASVQTQLKNSGIENAGNHFADETIVATGKVEQLNFPGGPFPVIVVADVKSIKIIDVPGQYTPTADYTVKKPFGFEVRYHPVFSTTRKSEFSRVSREVSKQLRVIVKTMPKDKVNVLKQVPIWVEWDNIPDKGAMFHPSRKWLKENKMNPAKAGGIEVSSTKNFLEWSKNSQPCILMHELAHAFHNNVLRFDNPEVKKVFDQAKGARLYDSVRHVLGGQKKAYALTNEKEYFAEITEAYFGKNDFFPFTKRDLERHDPAGFELVGKMWKTKLPAKKE